MDYTPEIDKMHCAAKGAKNGPSSIPQEGRWIEAKEITDISGLTHGVGVTVKPPNCLSEE